MDAKVAQAKRSARGLKRQRDAMAAGVAAVVRDMAETCAPVAGGRASLFVSMTKVQQWQDSLAAALAAQRLPL